LPFPVIPYRPTLEALMAHKLMRVVQFVLMSTHAQAAAAPMRMPGPRIFAPAIWALVFAGSVGVAYAQKDVVVTTSGDRLVGEIKSVEKDVLTFSTDYSDSDFKIKWEKIASLESDRQFLLETFDGKRLAGALTPDQAKGAVQVSGTTLPLPQVSAVQPFERTFWSRFDAGFDLGYSLTKANSATQFSFGGTMRYRAERDVDTLFGNAFNNSQENAPTTSRWDVTNDYRHLLGERWYVNTTQDFLNSEEQGLDLRTTIGGGVGRYLLRSSSQYLALGTGLAWTNENYSEPDVPSKQSGEAYLGTEFMTEKLKVTDVITRLTYYPSLTISGRHRFNYRFDLDFNLPGDWYFRIGFFDNYDNRPPAGFAANDYGWSNSFGLKF
jgi:putative salt-induced outer membrane protein YdiY